MMWQAVHYYKGLPLWLRRRRLFSLGLFGLLLVFVGAAEALAQYRFDYWTTDNGLPQNEVSAITQTPDGYLWFATNDGLVRYDGVRACLAGGWIEGGLLVGRCFS